MAAALTSVDEGVKTLVEALGVEPKRPTMLDVHAVLRDRAVHYGDFRLVAKIAREVKGACHWGPAELSDEQHEAIDMIAVKLARICAGDPHFKDHWVDIAGYAQLVAERLK